MELDGFLNALGDFLVDMAGAPIEILVSLQNGEMHRVIGRIAPACTGHCSGAFTSLWYSSDLHVIKQEGQ